MKLKQNKFNLNFYYFIFKDNLRIIDGHGQNMRENGKSFAIPTKAIKITTFFIIRNFGSFHIHFKIFLSYYPRQCAKRMNAINTESISLLKWFVLSYGKKMGNTFKELKTFKNKLFYLLVFFRYYCDGNFLLDLF